uniref:Uncharacterized protein LOC101511791 isoform X2 n=1 Tax=Cicer arietinum TaxID=3827 RepID=A0A1S3ECP1_CICAR|nr:uncharacterized protein LOC101511791 isoform X2 [Cicer arietinum]
MNDEMLIGWPLGLSFLNMRLRVAESLPAASSVEPYQLHMPMPCTSFSSFSTSNLDTESTASFFQDNSVSLAQLIGFRTGRDRGRLYFPTPLRFEERNRKLEKGSCSHGSKVQQGRDISRAICIPLVLDTLLKFTKSKKSSRN